MLTEDSINTLYHYLQGTCMTLIEGMEACGIDEKHEDACGVRMDECGLFLCENCGWWCEDFDEDGVCEDCRE